MKSEVTTRVNKLNYLLFAPMTLYLTDTTPNLSQHENK